MAALGVSHSAGGRAGWSPGSSAVRGCAENPGRVGRAAAGGAAALGPQWEGAAAASGADDGGRAGSLEPLEEPRPEEPGLGEPGPEGPAGGEVWGLPAAVRPWGAGGCEAGENGSDPNSDLMVGPAGLPDGDGRKTARTPRRLQPEPRSPEPSPKETSDRPRQSRFVE
ncbi:PREDICTED: S-antigen protein-like [Cercocebus atys]|uniref:S-antigen protein-like n=1 Tax=Cercocebus atys TaxID=9531 RepID=UPI0005F395B0|nr:PREDICTED: S-antigen protein-like [Cercocebus atys]